MSAPDLTSVTPLTVSQWVERRLQQAILSGELSSGERILPSRLAEQWSVSATPVREAIHRLAATGLVEELAHRGARVKELSDEDLRDLYDLRLMLEPHALTLSLGASDQLHRTRMQEAFDLLAAAEGHLDDDPLRFEDAHRAFHRTTFERCGSQRLMGFLDTLSHHASCYRMLATRVPGRGGLEAFSTEHAELLALCLAADTERAAESLRRHLVATRSALLDSASLSGTTSDPSTDATLDASAQVG